MARQIRLVEPLHNDDFAAGRHAVQPGGHRLIPPGTHHAPRGIAVLIRLEALFICRHSFSALACAQAWQHRGLPRSDRRAMPETLRVSGMACSFG